MTQDEYEYEIETIDKYRDKMYQIGILKLPNDAFGRHDFDEISHMLWNYRWLLQFLHHFLRLEIFEHSGIWAGTWVPKRDRETK